jgi:hypothetical protein
MALAANLPRKAGLSSAPSRVLAASDTVPVVRSVAPVRSGPMSQPRVTLRTRDRSVKAT